MDEMRKLIGQRSDALTRTRSRSLINAAVFKPPSPAQGSFGDGIEEPISDLEQGLQRIRDSADAMALGVHVMAAELREVCVSL
jgi:hypothetical protein